MQKNQRMSSIAHTYLRKLTNYLGAGLFAKWPELFWLQGPRLVAYCWIALCCVACFQRLFSPPLPSLTNFLDCFPDSCLPAQEGRLCQPAATPYRYLCHYGPSIATPHLCGAATAQARRVQCKGPAAFLQRWDRGLKPEKLDMCEHQGNRWDKLATTEVPSISLTLSQGLLSWNTTQWNTFN